MVLLGMKILKKVGKSLLLSIVVSLWCFVSASWEDTACSTYSGIVCKELSTNYTKPFCVTNLNGTEPINYANDCIFLPLTNTLSSDWERDLSTLGKKDIIRKYCLSLYWDSETWRIYFSKPNTSWEPDWQQTFDSRQSLFLYALCSSFTQSWDNHPFINDNALLKDAFSWNLVKTLYLQQMSDWKDSCSLDVGQFSKCDMSIYVTKIFAAIMSDLYKIKYAQVLHVDTTQDFSSSWEHKIEDFMTWYHLSKESTAEKYQDLKKYVPKTVSILKSNQMYYKSVLDTVKIIDNVELAKRAEQVKCPETWNMVWLNFVACALHSSQKKWFALTPSFVTLVYNEVLHYSQFMLYYKRWVERLERAENEGLYSELKDFEWYTNKQLDAVERVQRDLQDFNMTYPLHIWLLMYIERIEDFRNKTLSKVVTSFYSLSEKLQNVQIPPS